SVWSLHAFPKYSSFLPQSKDMLVRLTADSKLSVGVNVSVAGCLSLYHFMRERPKLNLRRPLVLWSLSLAIFSIIGALRTGLYMVHVISNSGFRQSVCDSSFYSAPVTKFWAYAFVLSKAPELGDTVFIILRKQRLIFLHWYHHITVLLYSWYSYKDQVAAAITQMAVGLTVLGLVYRWIHEVNCPSNMDNITWGSLMYLSYLVLFALFFYNTYLRGSSGAKGSKAE
uniref:Elongation of very long chain fatty acids protein n=1 Tax=Labrus bergylta TaxID=56723 RepID=A0A3Q3EPZ8_9LABR